MKHLAAFLWLHLGQWFDAKGMPSLAEACYSYAAKTGGRLAAEALMLLGNSRQSRGVLPQAIVAYQEAVKLNPAHARAWCGLGAAQRQSAQMEASRHCYERALELEPLLPQALSNLGEWWLIAGEPETALEYFDRVLRRNPNHYEALSNRVAALIDCGRYQDAEQAARAAIAIFPDKAPIQVNLGNVLMQLGKFRPALVAFNKALELRPSCEEAFYNRASLLGDPQDLRAAIAYIRRQIDLKGETASLLGRLALAQSANDEITAAEATCRKLLSRQPEDISALISLSGRIAERGDPLAAIEPLEKALTLVPQMPAIYSNLLFLLTYAPAMSRAAVFQRHLDWAQAYEAPNLSRQYRFPSGTEPGRRLKIGYVSGDFCTHPVGFLLSDVLNCHDQIRYEIHCYSHVRFPDQITAVIRSLAAGWHDVVLTPDDELAEMIHDEGIDILVDLSGHTGYNRLPVFISKPAPIQATWIGYFHSTGLTSIDYFITDPYTSPAGSGQLFSEIPLHLPHTRFCYSPPGYTPEVADAPVTKNGFVTFGSFNRLPKLVDPVIDAWAAILAGVPGAKLLIKSGGLHEEEVCERLRNRLAARGLAPERVILRKSTEHQEMLGEYGDIDIALDTFPFNGGMTTLEALWMGVPVVTIAGDTVVSRQTVSALANIGLADELAFPGVEDYVAGAVALANNPTRLAELRSQIRPRMAASPLRQSEQFTRDLEALYRRMWQAWCSGRRLKNDALANSIDE